MRRHPDVERSPLGKEVHYFDRFWQGNAPDDIAAEYASLFPRSPGKVVGRMDPALPRRLLDGTADSQGRARRSLLVMLRDPVARYRSAIARLHRFAEERGQPRSCWRPSATRPGAASTTSSFATCSTVSPRAGAGAPVRALRPGPDGRDGAHLAVPGPGAAEEDPRPAVQAQAGRPETPELSCPGQPRSSPSATGRTPCGSPSSARRSTSRCGRASPARTSSPSGRGARRCAVELSRRWTDDHAARDDPQGPRRGRRDRGQPALSPRAGGRFLRRHGQRLRGSDARDPGALRRRRAGPRAAGRERRPRGPWAPSGTREWAGWRRRSSAPTG